MKKKYIVFLLPVIFVILFIRLLEPKHTNENECCFCNNVIIENQKYYEDDSVIGLYTHKPLSKGHCLIIPKRHVLRYDQLTEDEIVKIHSLIKRTDRAVKKAFSMRSYMILQKNGKEVGQEVFHVHFHYIPAKENSYVASFLMKFIIDPFKGIISKNEIHDSIEKIKKELDN